MVRQAMELSASTRNTWRRPSRAAHLEIAVPLVVQGDTSSPHVNAQKKEKRYTQRSFTVALVDGTALNGCPGEAEEP